MRLDQFLEHGLSGQKAIDKIISKHKADEDAERERDAADHADDEAESRVDDEQERSAFDADE